MSNDNNDEAKDGKFELEVAPIESITKAEIDVQIATARQFPRSLAQFYKRAEAMITSDQDTAESCFYQLRRKDNKEPSGFKVIEGESIRMAEIVAANFGNLRSAVHISGHSPTRVSVRAVCHDLETNNLIAVEKQARTTYSDGRPYNEDMAIMTANALVSKALRDAIFRVVPKALIKPLREKARLVAFGSGLAFVERRKKAIQWATVTRKVPIERVLAVLGVKGEEDMTIEHLEILTGLKNAIMEGDQTVDEAFPAPEASKPMFEHPAKKEQESEQKQAATKKTESAKTTVAAPAKTVSEKPKTEAKSEKKPEPEPVVEKAVQDQGPATIETTATPSEPAATTEPDPEPEFKAPEETSHVKAITENQTKLRDEMAKAGYNFSDFIGWAGSSLPAFKSMIPKPTDWTGIPDDASIMTNCAFLLKQTKGAIKGIESWKSKQ